MSQVPGRKVPSGRLRDFMNDDDLLTDELPKPTLPPRPQPTMAPASTPAPAAVEVDGKGPEDRSRASNCHVPVSLIAPLERLCSEQKLSHGEAIIVALEASYLVLGELVRPAATAGGSLFASRKSGRTSRAADGPLTPLNYRLRESDFNTIDRLVEEFGASSRGHLITVALTHYLKH